MSFQLILYLLALINFIILSVMIYHRKGSWITALSITEIIIVYLSLISP